MARTLEHIRASRPTIDRDKIAATTEVEIRRHAIQDGSDFEQGPAPARLVVPAAHVRAKLGMTQVEFAEALDIPVATLRNWEQGRTRPDPVAVALLRAVYRDPVAVLAAIGGTPLSETPRPGHARRRSGE